RVMKVGRSTKAAVPPGVVERVRQYAFETRGSNVGGHLVADQADLSQQERRDARVWRIVEWRYKESRSVRALLMNVIDDFRKPFFPKQTSDDLRLFQIKHEPVAIVVVPGVVMIKFRRVAPFGACAQRLTIIIGHN